MASSIAASAFFPVPPASSKTSMQPGRNPDTLDARGFVAKPGHASRAMHVKASAQAAPKVNGTKLGLKTDSLKSDDDGPRTFYNQLPDWSMLLAAITTIFLAAEKQWALPDWRPKRPDMLMDAVGGFGKFVDVGGFGKFVDAGMSFRQNFPIRSYEIGADRTTSIETLMNHLQETALNHVKCAGLMGDGFGSTPEMSKRNLIWVVTKMQVFVEYYPSWGDIVGVDTWVAQSGKNGMRRDWHVRDYHSGKTIMRATSVWVMMNKLTRRLSKIPEEVRREIGPYFVDRSVLADEDGKKLSKVDEDTADHIRKGLTPRWSDLDVNQHVNNVKYIGWILEGAPISILESHELASMTLEYRRECGRDNVLQSLTNISTDRPNLTLGIDIECSHLLRLEDGSEIVRGRTEWRRKGAHNDVNENDVSAASA